MTQCHLSESCELVAAYSDKDVISQAQTIISQSNWITVSICCNVIFRWNKCKIKSLMISSRTIILNLQRVNVMNERMINESSDQSHSVSSFLIASSTMNSWDNTCDTSVTVYCYQQRLSSVYCLKTWITKYVLSWVDFQTAELIILLFQIRLHHIEFII